MPSQARPCLYFSAAELPDLRERFRRDPLLADALRRLLAEAEEASTDELPGEGHAMAGAGQHGNYQAVSQIARSVIEPCSFAYALTGEARFAEKAVKALLHFSGYETWTGRMFLTWDPPWHSALETARFVQSFAAGLDWLGDGILQAERTEVSQALARLGVEPLISDWVGPENRVHALDSMGHNWWMVCVAAGGVGALALLGEDERAEAWVKRVVQAVPEFFRYPGNVLQNKMRTFDPEGGFYESLGYANYTLVHYAYLASALDRLYPTGLHGQCFGALPAELDGMAEYVLHFLYPSEHQERVFLCVDFGDQSREGAFSGDVTLYLARVTRDGRYRWVFDRCTGDISGPYQMLFYDPDVVAESPVGMPLSRSLQGIGWSSLRDTWENDPTMLAVKCGDTWNHAHADAGSFVVYAGGEPLLIDSGSCTYARPEYRRYYTETRAHNVVLLDGVGPASEDLYRGSKFPGRLYGFHDADDVRYVLADATGPFANVYRRFLRHFLWLDGCIVLVDDLLAHEPGHFMWLFHGEAAPVFENGRLSIRGAAASLAMDIPFPHGLEANRRDGYLPRDPDTTLEYLELRHAEKAIDTKLLAVIQAGADLTPASVTPRSGDEWIGATVDGPAGRWDVYCNLRADGRRMHRNSNLEIGGWSTDAFLLATRSDPDPRTLLVGGSYLRDGNGAVVFDCLSRCNLLFTVLDGGHGVDDVSVQGPSGSRIRFRSRRPPQHVRANGVALPPGEAAQEPPFAVVQIPP